VPLAYGQGAAVDTGRVLEVGGVSITETDTDPTSEVEIPPPPGVEPPPPGTFLDVVDCPFAEGKVPPIKPSLSASTRVCGPLLR
jgi:hypothetical protein